MIRISPAGIVMRNLFAGALSARQTGDIFVGIMAAKANIYYLVLFDNMRRPLARDGDRRAWYVVRRIMKQRREPSSEACFVYNASFRAIRRYYCIGGGLLNESLFLRVPNLSVARRPAANPQNPYQPLCFALRISNTSQIKRKLAVCLEISALN